MVYTVRQSREKIFKETDELWAIVKEEWDSIPKETVKQLYRSIPSRLKVTLKNKDLQSHY